MVCGPFNATVHSGLEFAELAVSCGWNLQRIPAQASTVAVSTGYRQLGKSMMACLEWLHTSWVRSVFASLAPHGSSGAYVALSFVRGRRCSDAERMDP